VPPPDPEFLERAWSRSPGSREGKHHSRSRTERFVDGALVATALVIDPDGSIAGFQDKVQIDPSEEGTYTPGSGRRVFQAGPLTFGVAICHEGWRYPETVRGPHGVEHTLCFTRTSTKRSPILTASGLRRSREYISREGGPVPRRREHLLFLRPSTARVSALRPRRRSSVGWDTTVLPSPTVRKDC